ncbi:MAG: hypothetical protein KG003_04220 [Bacteroidetes bacterium]|nr:hypothetical protein [Bacteroidota bacterium]
MKIIITVWGLLSSLLLHAQIFRPIPETTEPNKIYMFMDKPMYANSESMYLTFFVLTENDHYFTPGRSALVYFDVLDGRDEIVYKNKAVIYEGTATHTFPLNLLKGGSYKIKATTSWNSSSMPEPVYATKNFFIQSADFADIYMQYQLNNDLYFPGDTIRFRFSVKNANNQSLMDLFPEFQVVANGEIINFLDATVIQVKGEEYEVSLKLKDSFLAESGYITAAFKYGNQAYSKVYPLLFNSAIGDLSFLPEGGNFLADVTANLAFKCIDKSGIGIQVKGIIVDDSNRMVTEFSSTHRGMGQVRLTPGKGMHYFAKIIQPVYNKTISLPEVDTVAEFNLEIQRIKDKYVAVINSKRNTIAQLEISRDNTKQTQQTITLKKGLNRIPIAMNHYIPGIAKIRLLHWSAAQGERLVFLFPEKKIKVQFLNHSRYLRPGEKNSLEFRVTDEKGNPVFCKFAAAVVNEKDLNLVNDKQPNLFASMMFTDELKGNVEDPNWYFNDMDSSKFAALDLVMLTHGWRRISNSKIPLARKERIILAHYNVGLPCFPNAINPLILQTYYKIKHPAPLITYDINFIPEDAIPEYYYHRNRNIYICEDVALRKKYAITGYQNMESVADNRFANNNLMKAKKVVAENEKPKIADVDFADGQSVESAETKNIGVACIKINRKADLINLVGNSNTASGTGLLQSARRGVDGLIVRNSAVIATPFGISVRGTRVDGNGTFIDGMRVYDETELPAFISIQFNTFTSAGWSSFPSGGATYLKSPIIGENTINIGNSSIPVSNSVPAFGTNYGYSNHYYYQRSYYQSLYYYSENILTMLPRGDRENIWTTTYYEPAYSKYVEPFDRNPVSTMWVIPAAKTNTKGLFKIEFQNNYNEAVYRVTLEGFGAGMLLSDTLYLISKPEITLAWEMPEYVHSGDKIFHKFILKNHSENSIGISFRLSGADTTVSQTITLAAQENRNIFIPSTPKNTSWFSWIISYNSIQENFTKMIKVIPFQTHNEIEIANQAQSGMYEFELPSDNIDLVLVKSGNNTESLVQEAQSMIRQPYGCFEQVSSSNYPNLIVYEFLKNMHMLESSKESLTHNIQLGLNALQKYKTSEGGYEWFGHTPPHQALTAYGLIQFHTASKLGLLNVAVVHETQNWLITQQNSDGSFKNNTGKYDHFANIPDNVSNAYITYALAISGYPNLQKNIQHLQQRIQSDFDPYIAALLYRVYLYQSDTIAAEKIHAKLEMYISNNPDKSKYQMHTITNSTGYSAAMEMLCIYGMGLLQSGRNAEEADLILEEARKLKKYISTYQTQANALFFEFMAMHLEKNRNVISKNEKENLVYVNGIRVMALNNTSMVQVIQIPENYLHSGKNQIHIAGCEGSTFFKANANFEYPGFYYKDTGYFSIKNNWQKSSLHSGESNIFHLEISNQLQRERGQTVACVYFPDGMQPGPEVLNNLMKQKKFNYYEIQGNCLTLYFLKFLPGEIKAIDFGMSCLFAGEFQILPPKVFAFYEDKNLNTGKKCKISILP